MSISRETVEHVAKLSKLSFDQGQIDRLAHQLTDIMNMVETLEEVDTTNVQATTNVIYDTNRFRDDIALKGTDRDELMKNAPVHQDGYIKVPAMLNDGGNK